MGLDVFRLANRIKMFQNPDGTKKHPAKTCKDLKMSNKKLKSGEYWVDPNGGAADDAILVFCDFENNSTCINPVQREIETKQWYTGEKQYKWIGELVLQESAISYNADTTQITFLKMLSKNATQTITYHCRNSAAWYNTKTKSTDGSMKLRDDKGDEITSESVKVKPSVLLDGCKEKDNKLHKTIIQLSSTTHRNRLPIQDVAMMDIGSSGQEFGIEIGRACFA